MCVTGESKTSLAIIELILFTCLLAKWPLFYSHILQTLLADPNMSQQELVEQEMQKEMDCLLGSSDEGEREEEANKNAVVDVTSPITPEVDATPKASAYVTPTATMESPSSTEEASQSSEPDMTSRAIEQSPPATPITPAVSASTDVTPAMESPSSKEEASHSSEPDATPPVIAQSPPVTPITTESSQSSEPTEESSQAYDVVANLVDDTIEEAKEVGDPQPGTH